MKTLIASLFLLPAIALAQTTTYVRFQKGASFDAIGTVTTPINARDLPNTMISPGNYETYSPIFDMTAFNSVQVSIQLYVKSGSAYVKTDQYGCSDVFSVQTRIAPRTFTVPASGTASQKQAAVIGNSQTANENGQIFGGSTQFNSGTAPVVATTNIDSTYVIFRLIQNEYRVGNKCYAYISVVPNTVRDSRIFPITYGYNTGETRQISTFGRLIFSSQLERLGIHTTFLQNSGTITIICALQKTDAGLSVPPPSPALSGPYFILKAGTADFDGTGGTITLSDWPGWIYCKTTSAGDGYITSFGY
jgi:hypothetical protein